MAEITYSIQSIRRKTEDGYSEPIALGSKPQFISSLRNSNSNNLEEQLILGTDVVKESWVEEDYERLRISYYDFDNKPSAYYFIDSFIFSDLLPAEDKYIVGNEKLYLTSEDEYDADNGVIRLNREKSEFKIEANVLKIENLHDDKEDKGFMIRRDHLKVHRDGQADTLVSTKTTYKTYPVDGVSKTIEIVTNELDA